MYTMFSNGTCSNIEQWKPTGTLGPQEQSQEGVIRAEQSEMLQRKGRPADAEDRRGNEGILVVVGEEEVRDHVS